MNIHLSRQSTRATGATFDLATDSQTPAGNTTFYHGSSHYLPVSQLSRHKVAAHRMTNSLALVAVILVSALTLFGLGSGEPGKLVL